jgi:hypothetical protein
VAFVQVAASSAAQTTGVAGASLTGVIGGHGLVCFAVYNSVATSLALTDSSGTTWAVQAAIALTSAKIAVFKTTSAVNAGTHTVTASFSGGGGAWTTLVEDDQSPYVGGVVGQKLTAPGAGNTLLPGGTVGITGCSTYQIAIDNTHGGGAGFSPGLGALGGTLVTTGFDATAGSWTIGADTTLGGTNSGMAPGSSDSTGADTYGVLAVAFDPSGNQVTHSTRQVVLVDEDVGPQQRTPYPLGMFFNRSVQVVGATPLAYLSIKTPPWEFYRDPFTSVYSVVEFYSQATQVVPSGPFVIFNPATKRLAPPEEDLRRFDHQQYFQISRHYTAQIIGYTVEVPDFNDHPWIEWVHPAPSPESALLPFRRQIVPANPYQIPIMWGQPKPWPVTEELDSVFRKPDVGVLLPYPRPAPLPILMPNLIGFDQQTAIGIILSLNLIYLGSVFEDEIYWQISPPTTWNPTGPFPPDTRGIVIGQWPLPGTVVQPLLTQVTLYLSSGKDFAPGTGNSTTGNVPNTVIGSTQFP